jgi:hypothetical protein
MQNPVQIYDLIGRMNTLSFKITHLNTGNLICAYLTVKPVSFYPSGAIVILFD